MEPNLCINDSPMSKEVSSTTGKERSKKPNIGIVGHSGAGKTTLLAVLDDVFDEPESEWKRAPLASKDASEKDGDVYEKSYSYVNKLRTDIRAGFFPKSTPSGKEPNEVWRVLSNGSKRIELRTFDPAGQLFSNDGHNQSATEYYNLLKRLCDCDAVAILLDPKLDEERWIECFDKIKEGLHTRKRTDSFYGPRLAICVSKADELEWQQRFRTRDARRWAMRNRPRVIDCFEKRLGENRPSECRWFFVSTVGWNNGTSNIHYFVDSHPIDDSKTAEKAGSAPMFPAPAASLSSLKNAGKNLIVESRVKNFFPPFASALQCVDVDTDENPVYDVEIGERGKEELAAHRVRGIHVGFGGVDEKNKTSYVRRPWNIVEPILWLAETLEKDTKNE